MRPRVATSCKSFEKELQSYDLPINRTESMSRELVVRSDSPTVLSMRRSGHSFEDAAKRNHRKQ